MNEDKKIKLLIFTPTLECGGSENYVSLLCNNIDKNRFDVTLIVLNDAHPFYTIDNSMIDVIDLAVKRVRNSLFRIKKIVQQKQPDIIFSSANHLNLLFAMYRWMFPKKILIVARESSIVSINSRHAQFPALYKQLVKRFYSRIDHIICQSAYMQHDLVSNFNIPQNKTVVIHNPVGKMETGDTSPSSGQVSPKIYKFITVGRLSTEKGIDRLIRSVAHLSIPFQYDIIGEGSQRAALQEIINSLQLQDKVFLKGEKINPYLHMEDADLFLMGSHYEGFPNVVIEAGSLGIPVIAYDVPGGTREIIADGENGLLVGENVETAFAAAIEKALTMNFNRNEIIAATKKRYAVDVIIPEVESLFLRLLNTKTD